jgi:hypothetical protein
LIAKVRALFFMLVVAATAHAQQEREDRLQFGALRFGMSLDEARTALICEVKPGSTVSAALAAAVNVAEQMQLEPTLRDGTSAAGGHLERKLTFKPHR